MKAQMSSVACTVRPVGNFIAYPRVGELVASPDAGWPAGWKRGAKALGYQTEAGGVVVGTVQGYDPKPRQCPDHPVVMSILHWCRRHPEAAAGPRAEVKPARPASWAEYRLREATRLAYVFAREAQIHRCYPRSGELVQTALAKAADNAREALYWRRNGGVV